MTAPDMDVIKEIPGYKVILKSVLKSQIQQLVEQLATTTDEESVILTASVSDGTLSHLGSDSGKGFLEDHEDIKSQFLGFCLKKHHRKKQEEKERQEAEALQLQQSMQASPLRMGPRGPYGMRSPRYPSPRGPAHPVSIMRAYPGGRMPGPGVRHEPYPMTRPRRSPLNFDPGRGPGAGPAQNPVRKNIDGQIIKIEPEDDNDASNQSESDKPGSSGQSPSQTPSKVKSESGNNDDDDDQSESSNSNIPNEQTSETNIGLDSDLSGLISASNTEGANPDVSVKLEALTESEMELEITGVEPGRPMVPQDNWDPNVSMGMNFDPTGATGSPGDMSQQGYSVMPLEPRSFDLGHLSVSYGTGRAVGSSQGVQPDGWKGLADIDLASPMLSMAATQPQQKQDDNADDLDSSYYTKMVKDGMTLYACQFERCEKLFSSKHLMKRHLKKHTGEKPFHCQYCDLKCSRKDNLRSHMLTKHQVQL